MQQEPGPELAMFAIPQIKWKQRLPTLKFVPICYGTPYSTQRWWLSMFGMHVGMANDLSKTNPCRIFTTLENFTLSL